MSNNVKAKPFIPRRAPPTQSVYTTEDYDNDGNLNTLKEVPLGPKYEERRDTMHMQHIVSNPLQQSGAGAGKSAVSSSSSSSSSQSQSTETAPNVQEPPLKPFTSKDLPGNPDVLPDQLKKPLKGDKYDVETPVDLRAPHNSQYVAVVRTIENHHPDEDRILQHYYLQYVARREGTYDPIEDPPVVLSTIMPTACVIIDRVFSYDEIEGDGLKRLEKYVQRMASRTDFDVVPVKMGKPFHVPLPLETNFKYKHHVIDQIMSEWYESHQESASEILARVEADRNGEEAEKPKWHVYDGISKQGIYGPNTKIESINEESEAAKTQAETVKSKSVDEDDIDDDDNGSEGWKKVPAAKKVGGRRVGAKTPHGKRKA